MAFQGDVAQIPLTNILQALILTGQEGMLTLQSGTFRRRIRLLKQGLRPLNYERGFPDLLREVLLKQKLLTESQFQNIFSAWNPNTCCSGDFLVRRHILSQESVTTELRRQLENLLFDIFLVPNLQYEFCVGNRGAEFELFSPDELGETLIYNANTILMEAARRDDEWKRFRTEIAGGKEIFQATNPGALSARGVPVPENLLKELRPLLANAKSVDAIIAETTFSAFEVYNALYQLKMARLIRPLQLAEKKVLAEKLKRSLQHAEAAAIFESILYNEPHDLDSRTKLIALLEAAGGRTRELIEHYLCLAAELEEKDTEQSIRCLRKILDLSPHHVQALERLFTLYHTRGRHREASATVRQVIAASRTTTDNPGAAHQLLHKLVNFCPQDAALLQELAAAALASKDADTAVLCLKSVAEIYKTRGELHKLRKVCERIVALSPSEAAELKVYLDLEPRRARRPRRLVKLAVIAFIAAAVGELVLCLSMQDYYSRVTFAALLSDVDIQKKYARYDRAKLTIRDFTTAFPISTRSYLAEQMLVELDKMEKEATATARKALDSRRGVAEDILLRAQIEASRQDFPKALELIEKVDRAALSADRRAQYEALQSMLATYTSQADEVLKSAKLAREKQDIERSHALIREILTRFPHSRAARDLRLPVQISTIPQGADLLVDGRKVGTTPGIFEFPPVMTAPLVLSKKGYVPFNLSRYVFDGKLFDPLEFWQVVLKLDKALRWSLSVHAPVECTPVALKDKLYFGTRGGELYCVEQDTGSVAWTFRVPSSMDLTGGHGIWNNMIYFGCFDGHVYVLNADTGKAVYAPLAASPEALPIKTAPSAASSKGVMAINCADRRLAGYNLASGAIAWSIPFNNTRLLGSPQLYQEVLYIFTSTGEIIAVAPENGEVQRRSSFDIQLGQPAVLGGDRAFLVNGTGTVQAVDLATLQRTWSYDCSESISGPPTVDSSFVVLPTISGKLICLSTEGQPLWVQNFGEAILAGGAVFRNTFFAGTVGGNVLCLDLWTGKLIWSFTPDNKPKEKQAGMLARGIVTGGKFFIGSENHTVYCLTLD